MSLGGCQAGMFGKPGVEGRGHDGAWLLCTNWKLRLCWNMILGVKNVQYLPEKGLAVGRFQLEGGCVTRGTNVAPELWVTTYALLPFPPWG